MTEPYQVKEGSEVSFRVTFKVFNNTVLGLSFTGELLFGNFVKVQNWDLRLGNYAPLKTEH